MQYDFWHRQTVDNPLFPDMVWSQPENKNQAGKLAVIGGNVHGFAAAAEAYSFAVQSGAGSVRVLLPNSLQKTVGKIFEVGEYAPSTASGSFAQQALIDFTELATWGDGTLIAGDLARNSETAIVLEQFMTEFSGQVTLTKDAVDYFTAAPKHILNRSNTLVVLSFEQLQKLAISAHFTKPFTSNMDLLRLIDTVHEFSMFSDLSIIVKQLDTMLVVVKGQVSTTKLLADLQKWRIATAARASVWWMQNPSKTYEALTTSVIR
jgi:hypothetical protein